MSKQEYLQSLANKGRTSFTLESYAQKIRTCENCLKAGGLPTAPERIDETSFQYLRNNLGVKESTIRGALGVFSNWVRWETGMDYLKKAEILWNRPPRCVTRISISDYRMLLSVFRWDDTLCMILLLGGLMGLRRLEMARIR